MDGEQCVTQEEDKCCLLSKSINFCLDCITFQCCERSLLERNLHRNEVSKDKIHESMTPTGGAKSAQTPGSARTEGSRFGETQADSGCSATFASPLLSSAWGTAVTSRLLFSPCTLWRAVRVVHCMSQPLGLTLQSSMLNCCWACVQQLRGSAQRPSCV